MRAFITPTIKIHRIIPTALLSGSGPEVTVTNDEMDGTEEQYFGAKAAGSYNDNEISWK